MAWLSRRSEPGGTSSRSEYCIVERLGGGDDEQAAERGQLREMGAVAEQMLDLRREVEGQLRPLGVQRAGERERVSGAIHKIGIAEGDMARPGLHLLADIGQHDPARHGEEAPTVYGRDRTVAAEVPAAAARLHVAGEIETPG